MWHLVIFLCFVVLSCSRIAFHTDEGTKLPPADYLGNSLDTRECSEGEENCNEIPFLQSNYKDEDGRLVENFVIQGRSGLEILFVVDSSDSMIGNLKKVGVNIQSMLQHLRDKKWRMAFITADHGDHHFDGSTLNRKDNPRIGHQLQSRDSAQRWKHYSGPLPRFGKLMNLEKQGTVLNQFILRSDTLNYEQIFKDTLTRNKVDPCNKPPYCHKGNEQPLRSLQSAFLRSRTDPVTKKFFKPNTDTVVLIITDEDERGNDHTNATTAQEVLQSYDQVFEGQGKRLFGFSISIQDKKCYKKEKTFLKDAMYGKKVGELARLTAGNNISLCATDYGKSLLKVSRMTQTLIQSLTLSKIFYIPNTVEVTLEPKQADVSWKLVGRKVVFSNNVRPGTQVTVRYHYE